MPLGSYSDNVSYLTLLKSNMQKNWTGKKSPTNPKKKEQHTDRRSREELIHRWQNDDWDKQVKEYTRNAF